MVNKEGLFTVIVFMLIIVGFSMVNAQTHQQDTDYLFSITSNFATECTLTTIDTPVNVLFINQSGTKTSQTFNFTINGTNFTELGNYKLNIECTDGSTTVTQNEDVYVNLSGVEGNMTLIIANIFLIILICGLIFILHNKYKNTDYKESNEKIGQEHNGNWGKTFIKTLGNNLMRNAFLWYYSLGWFLLIVLKDLVYNFNGEEIYRFFLFFTDIYSFGFFLIIVVWIGILINHFMFITDLIRDLNIGVRE